MSVHQKFLLYKSVNTREIQFLHYSNYCFIRWFVGYLLLFSKRKRYMKDLYRVMDVNDKCEYITTRNSSTLLSFDDNSRQTPRIFMHYFITYV